MPEPTNSPTTGVQPATQPATGVQPVSGVQPGVPFQDLTKWATKAPEGETLISTAYRDKVTDDLKFVENKPGVHKPDPILVADNVTRKFRRHDRRGREPLRNRTARHHRADRTERRRQNHVLQPDDRLRYAEHRHLAVRRQGHGPRATRKMWRAWAWSAPSS